MAQLALQYILDQQASVLLNITLKKPPWLWALHNSNQSVHLRCGVDAYLATLLFPCQLSLA